VPCAFGILRRYNIVLALLINWFLNAVSLIVVAHVIRGFDVTSFGTALIAALVIGLINATLGLFLKIVTFPLTLFTLGIFWFVVNALMLKLAASLVPGFTIQGFLPAFFGAIVLSILNVILKLVTKGLASSRHESRNDD
jgi:putative membrane protein